MAHEVVVQSIVYLCLILRVVLCSKCWPCDKRFSKQSRSVHICSITASIFRVSALFCHTICTHCSLFCFCFSLFNERETVTVAPSDSSLCFVLSLFYSALCVLGGIWVIGCILGLRWFLLVNGCLKAGNQSW